MGKNELTTLKENYAMLANYSNISYDNMLELAQKYLEEKDTYLKDVYAAILILYCWPALERLYYKQATKVLSQSDCYDIFMDSFLYVMEKHVWTDENSKLYNDEDAILKAMYVLVESRRKNYFIAQNRQKRAVNQYPISLDVLSDDFQEGYFSSFHETYNFNRGWDKKFVCELWGEKKYISAIIFDIVMNLNVFEDDSVNTKKIKKYLSHLSKCQYNKFLKRYDIIDNDLVIYNKYIKSIKENMIYTYIINAFDSFKANKDLIGVKEDHVD